MVACLLAACLLTNTEGWPRLDRQFWEKDGAHAEVWVELGAQVVFSGALTAPHTKYGHKASHPSGQEGGSRGLTGV